MSQDEMKKLLEKVHSDITSFDYNNSKVPCIILSEERSNLSIPITAFINSLNSLGFALIIEFNSPC